MDTLAPALQESRDWGVGTDTGGQLDVGLPDPKQCLVHPVPFDYLPVTNLGPESPPVVAHGRLKVVHGDRYVVDLGQDHLSASFAFR